MLRATVVETIPGLREQRIAGSIWYRDRDGQMCGIAFVCPCGCGNESWLPFRGSKFDTGGPSWEWNGDRDAPTLNPSVFNTGMPCKWHGWLRSGTWEVA